MQKKARGYLRKLCQEIDSRRTGTPGNRAATEDIEGDRLAEQAGKWASLEIRDEDTLRAAMAIVSPR